MIRRLLTACSVLSLLLLCAAVAWWVRSHSGPVAPARSAAPSPTTAPSPPETVEASDEVEQVRLTYRGPRSVPAGAPALVSLTMENRGAVTISYSEAHSAMLFWVTMDGPQGSRTAGPAVGDGDGGVGPGEALRQEIDLRQCFGPIPPGSYRLSVERPFNDVILLPDEDPRRLLQISDVPIEIKGPDGK